MKIIINGEAVEVPGGGGGGSGIPTGSIIMWSGSTIPDGWALCDGENGTPDLRGRFVLGESDTHPMGETGGAEEVTLTVAQMPSHYHDLYKVSTLLGGQNLGMYMNNTLGTIMTTETETAGSSKPHNNMPPYYALAYIMKL